MSHQSPSARTNVKRLPERGAYDRETIDAILDAGLVAHVGLVMTDGAPVVIPMLYARDGDSVLIHGSAANISDTPRRFMLLQYRAADAWPLLVPPTMNFAAYGDLLVSGEETLEPRMEKCPVRLGFPYRLDQFSIYENQLELENKYFSSTAAHPLVNAAR